MRICLYSCNTGPSTDYEKEKRLRELHGIAKEPIHELVDGPEAADLILVTNVRDENRYQLFRLDELVGHYPQKSFAIADFDQPAILLHGIYTSAEDSWMNLGRVRSGTYGLYTHHFLNPQIAAYARKPQPEKKWLFSFVGRNCHGVRETLFCMSTTRQDVLILDTSDFNNFDFHVDKNLKLQRQQEYCETIVRSKFVLCPRGRGTSSVRLFESMQLGVAPVIIADAWLPPKGPDWDACSLRIAENDLGNLEKLIAKKESDFADMGQAARQEWERYFAPEVYFNYLVEQCADIARMQRIPERFFWAFRGLNVTLHRLRRKLSRKRW